MGNKILEALKLPLHWMKNRLDGLHERTKQAKTELEGSGSHGESIQELEKDVRKLEESSVDLTSVPVDSLDDEFTELYAPDPQPVNESCSPLNFLTWEQFVHETTAECELNHVDDETLPWTALLTDEEINEIRSSVKDYKWHKWDYTVVGAAGVLATIVDFFCVAIPKPISTQQYEQAGSWVTEKLRERNLPKNWQSWLESIAKVPYDNTGGANHRIDTLGHDPVLGLVFGTMDILRGTVTTASGGRLEIKPSSAHVSDHNLITAFLTQLVHLVSDVATPKGLPAPFFTFLRSVDITCTVQSAAGKSRTVGDLALWMYHHGYDLRHFATMGIVPATIEIIVRAFIMINEYAEHGEIKFKLGDHPKYRSMLLTAHGIACAGNAGKVYIQSGNPLAINYPEWIALVRYMLPVLKAFVSDRGTGGDARDNEWNDLCAVTDSQLEKQFAKKTFQPIPIGKESVSQ